MSIVESKQLNTHLFNAYGFKVPSDPLKADLIQELLTSVKVLAPSDLNFACLDKISESKSRYTFEATMFFTTNNNQLLVSVKGLLGLDDKSNKVVINKLHDSAISIFSLGSLATPLELFSDATYTPEEIEKCAQIIFKNHEDYFCSKVLKKTFLNM